jgi:large conductance mechanosensitive channel
MSMDQKVLDELKKIREALEVKPAPPPAPPKGLWNEFKDFLSKFKVVGLAIAFILGLYLGIVIQALVKDLLMPVIGLALPGLGNLATYNIAVPPTKLDSLGNPLDPAYAGQLFAVGDFLVAVITFIIVALVVFILVKVAKRMHMLDM